MVVLVSSTEDLASVTIRDILISEGGFLKTPQKFDNHSIYKKKGTILVTTDTPLIHCEHLEKDFPTDLYVFLSRHQSTSNAPGLLTHTTGIWGTTSDFGGSPKSLALAPPLSLRTAFLALNKFKEQFNLTEYTVTLEVTHHGPSNMDTPVIFVEIGSTPTQWQNRLAAKAIAYTALELASPKPVEEITCCLGIGGPHYCPNFNRLVMNQPYAIGHVIPKYAMGDFDLDMISLALRRTSPQINHAVLDWKGIPGEIRTDIVKYLEMHSIKFDRVRDVNHG